MMKLIEPINKDKKSIKEQISHKTQELLSTDSQIVSSNNSLNFGKILLGICMLIGLIIIFYSICCWFRRFTTHTANIIL